MSDVNGKPKPRVLSTLATGRGSADAVALQNQLLMATKGKVEIIPAVGVSSCTPHNFNIQFAQALTLHAFGVIDYWCLRHDDIEPRTPGYLDVLVEECQRVGAAVISAVVPIKDSTGLTSTAVDTDDPYQPRKLSLGDCHALPKTFGSEHVGAPLLINTGLMLIDLSFPQWHATTTITLPNGLMCRQLDFAFNFLCRIIQKPNGEWLAQYRPEDWDMSRWCHKVGLPVYATNALEVLHKGDWAWSNQNLAFDITVLEPKKEAVSV